VSKIKVLFVDWPCNQRGKPSLRAEVGLVDSDDIAAAIVGHLKAALLEVEEIVEELETQALEVAS
jgi:hypothetical protein